jgi:3-hydroxyacyl-[acyl-carrier-protein] dehydratase
MRWIWIDRFVEFRRGKSARAVKYLSFAEDYFADHFHGYPVMPASLMLEGLAQTGGILVGEANDFKEKVVLAIIRQARFDREVRPGEQLTYDVVVDHIRDEAAEVHGTISAGQEKIGEAEILFAHLDQARSQQMFGDHNFVFTGEMKHLLGLARLVADRTETPSAGSHA